MAFANPAAYLNYGNGTNTGYFAISVWSTGATIAAGAYRRQTSPAVGAERIFVCIVAGTTHATTEPTWTTTVGAKTTDNTVTWQECTGQPGTNGDATNTPNSTAYRSRGIALGETIQDGTNVFICTTAGTTGAGAPTFNTTAGGTTTDSGVTWTCIGTLASKVANGFGCPHARLQTAVAASWAPATGINTIFVSSNHAETQASAPTITPAAGASIETLIISVTDTATPPTTYTAGASFATTGLNNITLAGGSNVFEGITFKAGSAANTGSISVAGGTNGAAVKFRNCTLQLNNTSVSSVMTLGTSSASAFLEFTNCTFNFGSASQSIRFNNGKAMFNNLTIAGTAPSQLTGSSTGGATSVEFANSDFSSLTTSLVTITNTTNQSFLFRNCRLGTGVSATVGTQTGPGIATVEFVNCDTSTNNTNYRYAKTSYSVTAVTTQTEVTIVKSGGSSDGTTPYSRKVVTNANCSTRFPHEMAPIYVWVSTTGSSITPLIAIVNDGTTLTNADIWCEAEYLGSSSSPLGSIATDGLANSLSTASNQPTDSTSTWTTTGMSSPVKQTVGPTFTNQKAGLVKLTVKIGRPSLTVYVDQEPTGLGFTSGRQYQGPGFTMNEGSAGGGGPVSARTVITNIGTY